MGFSIENDISRRLISVSYTQSVGPHEARHCFEKIQKILTAFHPGFRLLADFTQMVSMDASCTPYLEQIMDLCSEKGVALVVRIIPDPRKDIGFNIMSLFHYAREVIIVTCTNREEAARALAD